MEVSQLLRLYQARGWGALPAEDLLLYLKRLEHSGYQPGRAGRTDPAGGIWIVGRAERSVCCPLSGIFRPVLGRPGCRVGASTSPPLPPSLTPPHLSFVSTVCFFFFFHFCIKKKTLFSMSFCLSFFLFTLQLRTPSPRTVTI